MGLNCRSTVVLLDNEGLPSRHSDRLPSTAETNPSATTETRYTCVHDSMRHRLPEEGMGMLSLEMHAWSRSGAQGPITPCGMSVPVSPCSLKDFKNPRDRAWLGEQSCEAGWSTHRKITRPVTNPCVTRPHRKASPGPRLKCRRGVICAAIVTFPVAAASPPGIDYLPCQLRGLSIFQISNGNWKL